MVRPLTILVDFLLVSLNQPLSLHLDGPLLRPFPRLRIRPSSLKVGSSMCAQSKLLLSSCPFSILSFLLSFFSLSPCCVVLDWAEFVCLFFLFNFLGFLFFFLLLNNIIVILSFPLLLLLVVALLLFSFLLLLLSLSRPSLLSRKHQRSPSSVPLQTFP